MVRAREPGTRYGASVEIMTAAGPAHVDIEDPQAGKPAFLAVLTHGAGGGTEAADLLAVAR